MVFSVYWRFLLGFIVGERIGSRFFTNQAAIFRHKTAVNEVRKVMRTVPNAKPVSMPYEKPNSYFWF